MNLFCKCSSFLLVLILSLTIIETLAVETKDSLESESQELDSTDENGILNTESDTSAHEEYYGGETKTLSNAFINRVNRCELM